MRKTFGEFKGFLLRGNVVDLAVAVVIGAAFGAVVQAFVKDMITPLIAIPGSTDFGELSFHVRKSTFAYGDFLNVVISFISVAAAVFFFVVKPINHLMDLRKTSVETTDITRECPECMSSIPKAANRCAFCTAQVGAQSL